VVSTEQRKYGVIQRYSSIFMCDL